MLTFLIITLIVYSRRKGVCNLKDNKNLSFITVILSKLKFRIHYFFKTNGLRYIYLFLVRAIYFIIGLDGFWKIRNVIGSMKVSLFIDLISSTSLFVLVLVLMIFMCGRILFEMHTERFLFYWLQCLVLTYLLNGYIAFFYPGIFSGENVSDKQLYEILIPLLVVCAIPTVITLFYKAYNLARKVKV